jgi:hypothetical protein
MYMGSARHDKLALDLQEITLFKVTFRGLAQTFAKIKGDIFFLGPPV